MQTINSKTASVQKAPVKMTPKDLKAAAKKPEVQAAAKKPEVKADPKKAAAVAARVAELTAKKPEAAKENYAGKKITVIDKTTVENRREGTWSLFMNTVAITSKTTDEAQAKVDASEYKGKKMDWNYLVNTRKAVTLS